tara:strand:+ start:138 stop:659 length:522 start_codon:yes stop_codon:yes gene_type:complete
MPRLGLARLEALLEGLDSREVDFGETTFTGTGLKKMGYVDNSAAFVQNADSVVSWTQPANTIITDISLICTVAPETAASADLGFEVGTSSSGAQIVATQSDEIIDAAADGTDLAVGGFVQCTMVRITTDDTTLAADPSYSSAARTLYFNTTCSDHAVTTAGTVRWLIEYMHVA